MACEELKKEANKTIIEEKARIIYEDYISILSPKEVRTPQGASSPEAIGKVNPVSVGSPRHSDSYSKTEMTTPPALVASRCRGSWSHKRALSGP